MDDELMELASRADLPRTAVGVADSTAATLADLRTDHNRLLQVMRDAGLIYDEDFMVPNIHVDPVFGDDARTGTRFYPVRTISRAMTLAQALAGMYIRPVIGLLRGGEWREELRGTAATPNLCVVPYGPGPIPPYVNAANQVPAASWRATATPNVYEVDWVLPASANTSGQLEADPRVTAYRGASLLNRVTTVGGLAAVSDYYAPTINPVTMAGATIVVSIYATTDPRTEPNGTYEISKRQFGLALGSDSIIIGIRAGRAIHGGGSIIQGRRSLLLRSYSTDGTKHNSYVSEGEVRDSIMRGHESVAQAGSATLYVANIADPTGMDVTYRRAMAIGGPEAHGVIAFLSHGANIAVRHRNTEILGCFIDDCHSSYGIQSDYMRIARDEKGLYTYMRNTLNNGQATTNLARLEVDGVLVNTGPGRSGRTGAATAQWGATELNSIRNYAHWPRSNLSGGAMWAAGSAPCVWERLIILAHPQAMGSAVHSSAGGPSVRLNGCILTANTSILTLPTYSALSNYNVFRSSNGAIPGRFRVVINGVTYSTLAAWQAAGGGADSQSVYLTDAQWTTFFLGNPADGDFRVNPNASVTAGNGTVYVGTFPDGTPLLDKVGLEGNDVSRWPVWPENENDDNLYLAAPHAWQF